MNNNESTSIANDTSKMPDPRPGLVTATASVQALVATVETDDFSKTTPCDEFDVQALLDHMTMVVRRSAAIGSREHWSTVEQDVIGTDIEAYTAAIDEAAEAQESAWSDDSRLGDMVEVPWGTIPGGAAVATYTAELAVHGWDLATALGREFTVADDALALALYAVQQIPAEGRETPDVPFGPVVDPGPEASLLAKIAGWGGRQVA